MASTAASPISKPDIRTWIDNWNRDPRPYIWTKTAEQILESIGAYCQQLLKPTNDSGH
jgi:hypothetical protein